MKINSVNKEIFIKNNIVVSIIISIGFGYLLTRSLLFLNTDSVINFLNNNLTFILVSLIIINSSALIIILYKIKELLDKHDVKSNVYQTTKSMMHSIDKQMKLINEQIVLVLIAVTFIIVFDFISAKQYQEYIIIFNTFMLSCFVYEMKVLYNTVKSVIVVME